MYNTLNYRLLMYVCMKVIALRNYMNFRVRLIRGMHELVHAMRVAGRPHMRHMRLHSHIVYTAAPNGP